MPPRAHLPDSTCCQSGITPGEALTFGDSAMGGTLLIGLPPSSSGASHQLIPSAAGLPTANPYNSVSVTAAHPHAHAHAHRRGYGSPRKRTTHAPMPPCPPVPMAYPSIHPGPCMHSHKPLTGLARLQRRRAQGSSSGGEGLIARQGRESRNPEAPVDHSFPVGNCCKSPSQRAASQTRLASLASVASFASAACLPCPACLPACMPLQQPQQQQQQQPGSTDPNPTMAAQHPHIPPSSAPQMAQHPGPGMPIQMHYPQGQQQVCHLSCHLA
jgi:hypothetical protein